MEAWDLPHMVSLTVPVTVAAKAGEAARRSPAVKKVRKRWRMRVLLVRRGYRTRLGRGEGRARGYALESIRKPT
jgi:hypothetical protein